MKTTLVALLVAMVSVPSYAQKAYQVTTVAIYPTLLTAKEKTIRFPVFHFKEKSLERKINRTIREEILDRNIAHQTMSLKRLLELNASDGLTDLSLNSPTFVNLHVISFAISIGWSGAYPYEFTQNFVFDLMSGEKLAVTDLIKPERLAAFHTLVERKQKDLIAEFCASSGPVYNNGSIQKEEYDLIKERTREGCLEGFDPYDYRLYKDSVEVVIHCDFHGHEDLENYNNLFLTRTELAPFLKEDLY